MGCGRNLVRELELVNLSIPQRSRGTTTVVVNYIQICTHPDLTPSSSSPPPSPFNTNTVTYMNTHCHAHTLTLYACIWHTLTYAYPHKHWSNLFPGLRHQIQYECDWTNHGGKGMHESEANWDLTPVLVVPRTSLSLKKLLTTVTLQWTHS